VWQGSPSCRRRAWQEYFLKRISTNKLLRFLVRAFALSTLANGKPTAGDDPFF
jgi:hypothetical protein